MIRATDDPTAEVRDVDQAARALHPPRTRVWAPSGVPWAVETPGSNQKPALFGALHSRTGQTHFLRRSHTRSAGFQACVDPVLLPASPHADFLFLIVDGSSIDKSKSTRQGLMQRPPRVLVPLPRYAPRLTLQEQLWRWLRAEVTHNHFFRTFGALVAAAESFFAKLTAQPAAVLQRSGRAFPDLLEHHLAAIL